MNPARIIVIEDDRAIRRFLRASLTSHGFALTEAETGRDGLRQARAQPHDLMILDLGLPDMDGMDIIRRVREWSTMAIIILSARGQERDKVAALDAGADDYLTKPFGVGELLARIRVALRHSVRNQDEPAEPVFATRNLRLDLDRRQVFVDDREVHLTPIEYRLLQTLVKYAGKVVTHRHLLKEVWGPDRVLDTHYVRIYMGHLRNKIEAEPANPKILLTEPGVGYRLAVE